LSHFISLKKLIDEKKILKPLTATAQGSIIKHNVSIHLKIDFLY